MVINVFAIRNTQLYKVKLDQKIPQWKHMRHFIVLTSVVDQNIPFEVSQNLNYSGFGYRQILVFLTIGS